MFNKSRESNINDNYNIINGSDLKAISSCKVKTQKQLKTGESVLFNYSYIQ